jgi:hypothetical protein
MLPPTTLPPPVFMVPVFDTPPLLPRLDAFAMSTLPITLIILNASSKITGG